MEEFESEGLEELESESESEAAERRRWPPPSRASGTGLYRAPLTTNGFASRVQVAAMAARIGDQLKKNSSAIATVNSRVNTTYSNEKKDRERISKQIQMLAILPALIPPTSASLTAGTLKDSAGKDILKVVTPDTSTLNLILPLALIGFGGAGGWGSGSEGTMDSTMMLLLILALTRP
jgi:hypothetical protein